MITENIETSPKHTKQTFSYATSLAWQKLSYYGWRSILFFLFIDQVDKSDTLEITNLFLWISIGLSIAYIFGGILGDLLIGNKNTAIIGGIVMFTGSMLFFFDLSITPYIPITIFITGCGLYQSNLKSIYAKLYLHDTRLLDSGFLIFNLFINIGSFFGVLIVGLITEKYGVEYGFLTVGVSTILSIIMLLLTKNTTQPSVKSYPHKELLINRINLKYLSQVLALYTLYCFAWRLSYYDINALYWDIDLGPHFISYFWVDNVSLVFHLIIGIYLIILWTKKYYDKITKLTISAVITLVSFSLSYFLFNENSVTTSILTVFVLFAYTFADLLVLPIIDSSIAKLINRKFLAIAYGTVSIITMGIGYVFLFIENGIKLLVESTIYVGLGGLLVLSIILIIRKFKPE